MANLNSSADVSIVDHKSKISHQIQSFRCLWEMMMHYNQAYTYPHNLFKNQNLLKSGDKPIFCKFAYQEHQLLQDLFLPIYISTGLWNLFQNCNRIQYMMWQFNNQMLAKTLVFSNSGYSLESDLIKIYKDLKPARIGVTNNIIFVELKREIDDFELLSQCQLDAFDYKQYGLFEILQGQQAKMPIENCQIVFNSLLEIKRHYCQQKSLSNKQNFVFEGMIESQVQLNCSEQRQKSRRLLCSKDQLLILESKTLVIDIEDINEVLANNALLELEQSTAINIGGYLQDADNLHAKDKQLILDIQQNRIQDQQSFQEAHLFNEPASQKTTAQKSIKQFQPPLAQYQCRKLSKNEGVKGNQNQNCFYILLLLIFVILLI